MRSVSLKQCMFLVTVAALALLPASLAGAAAESKERPAAPKNAGPPPVPVRTAAVQERTVSSQISIIGTAEALAVSIVAAEVSGVVESFPVKAGDYVEQGKSLVGLKDTELQLRLKSLVAERDRVRTNLENAQRDLDRLRQLRDAQSVSETAYETALYAHRALTKVLLKSEAEIDHLQYQIRQTTVAAPFSGIVSEEHTQVGQYVSPGGPVVTLMDMAHVLVTVDVPERFVNRIAPESSVRVQIGSVSDAPVDGKIYAMLPMGNPAARTIPVRVKVPNPALNIRAGMEARVTLDLTDRKNALLVPKDAVVTAGNDRMVFAVIDDKAVPFVVTIEGYYDGDVAVGGDLKAGMQVVIRGNERLRPGQAVAVGE